LSTALTIDADRFDRRGVAERAAHAHGGPLFRARYRAAVEHFEVIEELGFEPDGEGEHDFLWIEKLGANTDWVARGLARHASVGPSDVGYAGRKDRHARTVQWFSVRVVNKKVPWSDLDLEGVRVLDVCRHSRKLRPGAHRGNHFRIRLVDVDERRPGDLVRRIDAIRERGVPNYFGPQRFGHDNLELAAKYFAGARLRRNAQSMAISAARAAIFNAILDRRVRAGCWDSLLAGDVANLDGTGSVFLVDAVDAELDDRARRQDLHPTGSLWGSRETYRARRDCAALEAEASAEFGALARGLETMRIETTQRSCRVRPRRLTVAASAGMLVVSFALPAGAFATSVLREIGDVEDVALVQPPSRRT
jgi:tRNA pseudouridine13 synthase